MNSKVENLIKELNSEFAKDVGYIRYKELENQIKKNTELYEKIKEFKRLKIFNSLDDTYINPIDANSRINILYTDIFFNDLGREYILLEKIISVELDKVVKNIYSEFDFDLNSLV